MFNINNLNDLKFTNYQFGDLIKDYNFLVNLLNNNCSIFHYSYGNDYSIKSNQININFNYKKPLFKIACIYNDLIFDLHNYYNLNLGFENLPDADEYFKLFKLWNIKSNKEMFIIANKLYFISKTLDRFD